MIQTLLPSKPVTVLYEYLRMYVALIESEERGAREKDRACASRGGKGFEEIHKIQHGGK